MNAAVAAKLKDPDLPLFHALRIGGFRFPCNEDASTLDNTGITLGQRKNQLARRLRAIRKRENEARGGEQLVAGQSSQRGTSNEPQKLPNPSSVHDSRKYHGNPSGRGMKRPAASLYTASLDDPLQDLLCDPKNTTSAQNNDADRQALFHPLSISLLSLPEASANPVELQHPTINPNTLFTHQNRSASTAPAKIPNQIFLSTDMLSIVGRNAPSATDQTSRGRHEGKEGDEATSGRSTTSTHLLFNQGPYSISTATSSSNNPTTLGNSLYQSAAANAAAAANANANIMGGGLPLTNSQFVPHPLQRAATATGPFFEEKEAFALQLFRQELKSLYRRSMLAAGFSMENTSAESQHFRRFAFFAWKNECERLQEILGDTDASAFN